MSRNPILVFICLLILSVSLSDSSSDKSEKDNLVAKPNPRFKRNVEAKQTTVNETKTTNNVSRLDTKSVNVADVTTIGGSNIELNDTSSSGNASYSADRDYAFVRKLPEHILSLDNGAVKRTFYVVAALTGVIVLYFLVKGVTLRRKPKVTRYGLLAEREIESLDDADNEDEDMTLFDASRYKMKGRGP